MFGHRWESGKATIVALKEVPSIGTDAFGRKYRSYDYVADVQPDSGGPVFRTTMGEPFNESSDVHGFGWHQPGVGEVMPVKCDPGRKKAKFDAAASRDQARAQHDQMVDAQSVEFDAMAASAPGTAAGPSSGQSFLGGQGVSVVNLSGGDISGALPAIQQALASGNLADLARIKAELRQQAHPDDGSSSDTVERLEKLAALHADGVLTDAEFAAAKAKLLGES
jgi:hypothetical protein